MSLRLGLELIIGRDVSSTLVPSMSTNTSTLPQGIFQDLEYGGVSQLMGVKLFFSFHHGTLHIFKLQQNGR